MKRYMIFSFPDYYPSGGLGDVQGSYDTLEEAKEAVSSGAIHISSDTAYIFDRIEGKIVFDFYE